MNIWRDLDGRFHRFGLVDTKLAQAGAFFFALVVASAFPALLTISIWWFVALTIACGAKPMVSFYSRHTTQP